MGECKCELHSASLGSLRLNQIQHVANSRHSSLQASAKIMSPGNLVEEEEATESQQCNPLLLVKKCNGTASIPCLKWKRVDQIAIHCCSSIHCFHNPRKRSKPALRFPTSVGQNWSNRQPYRILSRQFSSCHCRWNLNASRCSIGRE